MVDASDAFARVTGPVDNLAFALPGRPQDALEQDPAAAIAELQALGVRTALDDFGTGFTSFQALKTLPFDTLKIDRSFVQDCLSSTASAAIIHAVIGVGRALGVKVVCEGVETPEQAAFLRTAGAHYLQGYHFHKPMEVSEFCRLADRAA